MEISGVTGVILIPLIYTCLSGLNIYYFLSQVVSKLRFDLSFQMEGTPTETQTSGAFFDTVFVGFVLILGAPW